MEKAVYVVVLEDALEFVRDAANYNAEDFLIQKEARDEYADRAQGMIDRIEAIIGDCEAKADPNVKLSASQRQVLVELMLEESLRPEQLMTFAHLAALSGAISSFLPKRLRENEIRISMRALRRKHLVKIEPAFNDEGYVHGSGYTLTKDGRLRALALHEDLMKGGA